MKEDHAVAGILIMLISALIIGAISQSGSNGITASATFGLLDPSTTYGALIISIIAAIAVVVGIYSFYSLYLKGKKKRKVAPVHHVSFDLSATPFSGTFAKADSVTIDQNLSKVTSYVRNQRASGMSESEIRRMLQTVGWDSSTIEKALRR